jgi:hypothetical protein
MSLLAEEQCAKAKHEKLVKKRKEPKVCRFIHYYFGFFVFVVA